jgi:hypothetical protein
MEFDERFDADQIIPLALMHDAENVVCRIMESSVDDVCFMDRRGDDTLQNNLPSDTTNSASSH